jgi:hypothetical protein
MIVDNKVRSKSGLLADIALGAADVEMLASLSTNFFADMTAVVPFEPKLKERGCVGSSASVLPWRKPG